MAKALMYVEGMNGQLELLEDRVVIHRKGLWNVFAFGFNARREIPVQSLSSVNFRTPGLLSPGEIHLEYAGSPSDKKHNTIKFNKKQAADFTKAKEKMFTLIQARK